MQDRYFKAGLLDSKAGVNHEIKSRNLINNLVPNIKKAYSEGGNGSSQIKPSARYVFTLSLFTK